MIADRKDFEGVLAEKQSRKRAEMMPMIRLVAGAATVMAELQVDEKWTRYQQILQGVVEKWEAQRDNAKDLLGGSGLADADLRKLNTDVLTANAAISAWKLALSLPAAIAKGGEEAAVMVKEFEKKNETADNPKP